MSLIGLDDGALAKVLTQITAGQPLDDVFSRRRLLRNKLAKVKKRVARGGRPHEWMKVKWDAVAEDRRKKGKDKKSKGSKKVKFNKRSTGEQVTEGGDVQSTKAKQAKKVTEKETAEKQATSMTEAQSREEKTQGNKLRPRRSEKGSGKTSVALHAHQP